MQSPVYQRRKKKEGVIAYKCRFCKFWHVGHRINKPMPFQYPVYIWDYIAQHMQGTSLCNKILEKIIGEVEEKLITIELTDGEELICIHYIVQMIGEDINVED